MREPTFKCYLCGSPADEGTLNFSTMSKLIDCTSCKPYRLDSGALLHYFLRGNKKEMLNDMDKKKMVNYIQQEFEQTQKPVLITLFTVKKITGKI